MVQSVEIIEEIERTQDPRALDDGDALAHFGARPMLGKGADQREAGSGNRHGEEVERDGHPTDHLHPEDHRDAPREMLEPGGPDTFVVPEDDAPFLMPEPADGPEGADRDAAGQRLLKAHGEAGEGREPRPVLGCEVIGFRVVERIGEPLVVVVDEVTHPVALVRQVEREGHDGEQAVDASPSGRVAVHDLVLQRAV